MEIMILIPSHPHPWWIKQPPVAALYTAAILKGSSYKVHIMDIRYENDESWKKNLNNIDLIIIETVEYDMAQTYSCDLSSVKECIKQIRDLNCKARVVCIGAHGKISTKLTFKELDLDGILIGENEVVIPDFLSHYDDYRDNTKFVFENYNELNLDNLPIPAYELVDLKKYDSGVPVNGKIVKKETGLILANRGCPFSCAYCYSSYFGKSFRLRPVKKVIQEIKEMHSRGISHYFFLDYTFTCDKYWTIELLDQIRDLDFKITWGCETRIDVMDEELIESMVSSGCTYIWFGIESPDVNQMDLNKHLDINRIEKCISLTSKSGIQVMAFILIGFPNENIENVYNWCKEQPFIFDHSIILPRPETSLFNKLKISNIDDFNSWEELANTSSNALYKDKETTDNKFNRLCGLDNYMDNVLSNIL